MMTFEQGPTSSGDLTEWFDRSGTLTCSVSNDGVMSGAGCPGGGVGSFPRWDQVLDETSGGSNKRALMDDYYLYFDTTELIVKGGTNNIQQPNFFGTGQNDLFFYGTYTGGNTGTFTITINTATTFDWYEVSPGCDPCSGAGVSVGTAVSLNDGVSVSFGSTGGYTMGDQWIALAGAGSSTVVNGGQITLQLIDSANNNEVVFATGYTEFYNQVLGLSDGQWNNIFIGGLAYEGGGAGNGPNIDGGGNVGVGMGVGGSNTDGTYNTYLGDEAGQANETGSYNLFAGADAGQVQQASSDNVYLGSFAGSSDDSADNTAVGFLAEVANGQSTALGDRSAAKGAASTAVGYTAEADGSYSLAIGADAAHAVGDYSLALLDDSEADGDYSMAIGVSAIASGTNSIALGQSTHPHNNNSIVLGLDQTVGFGTDAGAGIDLDVTVAPNGGVINAGSAYWIGGTPGVTASGSSCSITAITGGIITGGACTP